MTIKINTSISHLPDGIADLVTPVSIYMRLRDRFPNTCMLESSDYHGSENSMSYIAFDEIATFTAQKEKITCTYPFGEHATMTIQDKNSVPEALNSFLAQFDVEVPKEKGLVNGLFGYTGFDSIKYFETIKLQQRENSEDHIPEMRYAYHRYILAFNHFKHSVSLIENLLDGESSKKEEIVTLLINQNVSTYDFEPLGDEQSNMTDEDYMELVEKGKEHCFRGDVFQIVISRQFTQKFKGDEFNVYRALRRINPSPYLFFFDFGGYRIFGSSPEAQIIIQDQKATINPIAGTFKRTGDDERDRLLAEQLVADEKENAEHVMLVDLARNDLSRNSSNVKVECYREVQYYSHVLHLVSEVNGTLEKDANPIKVFGDTFPAGTLSGAPKFKAMELIDKYEPTSRQYYGGAIGYIGFNGKINQAITIRSFLSKNNELTYQAGAGVVSASVKESELQEVNNKLGALKTAIDAASNFTVR